MSLSPGLAPCHNLDRNPSSKLRYCSPRKVVAPASKLDEHGRDKRDWQQLTSAAEEFLGAIQLMGDRSLTDMYHACTP